MAIEFYWIPMRSLLFFLVTGKLSSYCKDAEWVGISVVSRIEFMVFPGLSKADEDLFAELLKRVAVVDLSTTDNALIERVIDFRRKYAVKIPDAIIAATATTENAIVLTADRDFDKINELTVMNWRLKD